MHLKKIQREREREREREIEREGIKLNKKHKKRVSSDMSAIALSWVAKGTCEHYTVYWHQVSLHQVGVGWGFSIVIFKDHPLKKLNT